MSYSACSPCCSSDPRASFRLQPSLATLASLSSPPQHNRLQESLRSTSPPLRQLQQQRTPQRDSLTSTASSLASTLPSYTEASPPEYDATSSAERLHRGAEAKREEPHLATADEPGPAALAEHDAAADDDGDEEESAEPDALDLLLLRTSSILATSQSILDSTVSSRDQLARFFALDDTLHRRGSTLRLGVDGAEELDNLLGRLEGDVERFARGDPVEGFAELELEGAGGQEARWGGSTLKRQEEKRADPRALLRTSQGKGRGHAPRVATMYEAAEAERGPPPEAGQEVEVAPALDSAAPGVSEAPPSPDGATSTLRRDFNAAVSGSTTLPTPASTPPRPTHSASSHPQSRTQHQRRPSAATASLLSAIAGSSTTPSPPSRRTSSSTPTTSSPSATTFTPLRAATSAASLASILESHAQSSPATLHGVDDSRSMSTSATSPEVDRASARGRGFLAIDEEGEGESSVLPSSRGGMVPSTPRSSIIRHTRAPSAGAALSLLSSGGAAPPSTPTPPKHHRTSSSTSSSSTFARPPPSPSTGHSYSHSRDDLARVNVAGVGGGGAGVGLRERLQAAGGAGGGKKEGGGGGGWWWS